MERFLRRFLALMMVLWTSSQLSAQEEIITVGELNYSLSEETQTASIVSGVANIGELVIPPSVTYNGVTYSVTTIGNYAFQNSNITGVCLTNNIQVIGAYAFAGCGNLKYVKTSDYGTMTWGNDALGAEAFLDCINLELVKMRSFTYTNGSAFEGCNNLKTLILFATAGTHKLSSPFPENIYKNCTLYLPRNPYEPNGSPITIEELITEYRWSTEWRNFENVRDAFEISQRNSAGYIEGYTVYGVTADPDPNQNNEGRCKLLSFDPSLSTGMIESGIVNHGNDSYYITEEIAPYALYGCGFSSLTTRIGLPSDVKVAPNAIPSNIYENCVLYVPATTYDDVPSIDLYKEDKIWSKFRNIKETPVAYFTVDNISYKNISTDENKLICEIYDIRKLVDGDVTIPQSVEYRNKKYEIVNIAKNSFRDISPTTITMLSSVPPTLADGAVSDEIYESCKLIVPKKAEEAYKNSPNWSKFNTIEEVTTTFTVTYITYDIVSDENNPLACVVINADPDSEGIITIPAVVDNQGKEYTIVGFADNVVKEEGVKSIIIQSEEPPMLSSETFSEDVYNNCALYVPKQSRNVYEETEGWNKFKVIKSIDSEIESNGNVYTIEDGKLIISAIDKNAAEVDIPEELENDGVTYDVTAVSKDAFSGCSQLKKLTLPSSIEQVENSSFIDCNLLRTIYIYAVTPPVFSAEIVSRAASTEEFPEEVYEECLVCVPAGALESYRTAPVWENFKNILEIGTEPSLSLDKEEASVNIGETITLTATVIPDNATLSWKSSNEEVAIVTNGEVKGLKAGEAVITVTSSNGFSAECTIMVIDPSQAVKISSLMLSETDVELPLNYTYSLFGIIAPENATNTELEWSTSNPEVARVYEGVVYGMVPGEAVITAKTTDGSNLSASCKFTIVATSGIEGTEGDAVKVSGKAGIITVNGAAVGATVEVYSMSGACVAAKTVESSVEELPVAASGIYVVRVNGKTFKVAL